jgi:Ca-activated chloride channel family protein
VDAPAGASGPGARSCRAADACVPLELGAVLTGDHTIDTAEGARASLDLGGGATLELAGRTAVAFTGGDPPGLRVTRGTVAITTPAAAAPLRFDVGVAGRPLVIDPAMPAAVAVRAAGDRAEIAVHRGRASVGEGAARVDLRSGDGARLLPDGPAARGLAGAVDEDLDGRPEDAGKAQALAIPRGLGTMSARVPGTSTVVSGVRLVKHAVEVTIEDGFAHTEVEEEFANDTDRVLEGRYAFALPPEASLSRLALWVGDALVEGEVVERDRAAAIFKGIVDDSVRPRDPALLEWVSGGELSLKVFPIMPHASRKVVLGYDQVVSAKGGRARYGYPLSLGEDRTTRIDDFAIRVHAKDGEGEAATPGYAAQTGAEGGRGIAVSFQAKAFTPAADFVVVYDRAPRPAPAEVVPASLTTSTDADRVVAVRVPVAWPEGAAPPERTRRDRAVVIDVSHSQSKETLAGQSAVAGALIAGLDPDERFVLLACDSACAAYPEDGLAAASDGAAEEARAWLGRRAIGGSSDVAGALVAAARRLEPGGAGQVVYLGDGAATSGELSAATIAARVRPEIAARGIDVRLVGAGRTVDEVTLGALARELGGSYERLADGDPLDRRAREIAVALRAPLLRGATVEIPPGLRDVEPKVLPALRVGQELLLVGRAAAGTRGEVRLRGDLGGTPYARAASLEDAATGPGAGRIWAAARIAELEGSDDPAAAKEVVALSKQHHVMSRRTALLVLENDRMFAELGIARTHGEGGDTPPTAGGGGGHALAADRLGAALRDAQAFGMIGALGGSSTLSHATTLGSGAGARASDLSSGAVVPVAPPQGLSGIGEGGGGRGEGIGLGAIGTPPGRGSSVSVPFDFGGSGAGQGFGSGHSALAPPAPQVHASASTVSGSFDSTSIQSIVRGQFGRLRRCYQRGLDRDAGLAGRVVVRFVIGRDGTVTSAQNGGSTIADPAVVACVVGAFSGMTFPAPDGGSVTVVFPISFTPGAAPPSPPPAGPSPWEGTPPPERAPSQRWNAPAPWHPSFDGPSAVHRAGDDAWMKEGEDALAKLREAAAGDGGASRQRREALIHGLLARGRFAEALGEARTYADLDPDRARSLEMLAGAAAAAGEGEAARAALDAEVELSPASADLHARAARAFEAAGDEARACAHWRSLAELRPRADDARYEALRCRARLGDREAAAHDADAVEKPGKLVDKLRAALAGGAIPAYDTAAASPGEYEVTVRCDEPARCPDVVVVKPGGDVVSPWAPAAARSGAHGVAFAGLVDGTYRTVLVGGAPDARGEVEVRAWSSVKKLRFDHGGLHTVAATVVTNAALARF